MSHATDAAAISRTQAVSRIASEHAAERGPLLVLLHAVMDELGHLERGDVETIAHVLNLSVADVHGVVSFYKDFRTAPAPAHTIHLCRAEACQSLGAEALYAGTTAQFAGRDDVEVEQVFCFGNCALGPSGTVDGRLHGRLSPERIESLTAGWQA
jgi:formate dehydrogenase subunit gamma